MAEDQRRWEGRQRRPGAE
jgi:hypothetical protein